MVAGAGGHAAVTGLRPAWSEAFDPPRLRPVPRLAVDVPDLAAATGAGVRVAVVDSGVDLAHPAVAGPVGPWAALTWDADQEAVVVEEGPHDDVFGHGTACAGLVRAQAPACELSSVRVLGPRLSGKGQVFAAGLQWAIRSGAHVVSLSLSSNRPDLFGAFHELADEAYFRGVVLVCAMNNVPAPTYPSEYASVVSVAATAGPHELLVSAEPPAEFGAPGIDVEVPWPGGGTMVMTGNSFAAPRVAGLVARLLSARPGLAPYEVKTLLRALAANATGP